VATVKWEVLVAGGRLYEREGGVCSGYSSHEGGRLVVVLVAHGGAVGEEVDIEVIVAESMMV